MERTFARFWGDLHDRLRDELYPCPPTFPRAANPYTIGLKKGGTMAKTLVVVAHGIGNATQDFYKRRQSGQA
jgi:hypothetical protein